MKKLIISFCLLFFYSCQNFGQLEMIAGLPKVLDEVSGTETIKGSDLIWMLNDSGNQPKLFAVSEEGKILKEIYVKTKNHDWEDLTADKKGNLYIGDFGNNNSKRKNLRILKVDKKYLNKKNAEVEKIEFEYEDQNKFPPKKKNLFFDSESFFYHNNHFYIFTKSRTKKKYGKTSLYRIPAEKGKHKATLIGKFDNGKKTDSWITSADISDDGKKVVLLSQKNILIFTDFKGDNFLSGNVKEIELTHETQKEGICFKDNTTLLITDEKSGGEGGNLYQLKFE
ncbi:SdiA-regulated domain-containing protein [Polaribacter sp. Asnod6-C07]|uniref:SdiA-regulated domain-containing protein n=1 Tax=Polaribacter sp. Asnod6-C07 TaxID=3160582 RepID=UPI00386BF63E